ncbi:MULTISPECIES: hypothetical protein [Streptomyces]|uniref:Immunity protein 35 of polymorphic toxin system n=1 Tax=Streptomyces cavourensis TaxID=67258 RepID=A0ABY5FAB8_9ACTN|nr:MULTISPECIES: hypothetical protein [Streptomyces]UTR80669.1 hypothetical protein NLU04_20400 [Streptomyces cavourensis]WST13448.1 hypothetical protein OG721_05450 [Streptomyces microflavus]SCK26692.1 hypothetical protein YUYDRAFT_02942 [Streptomyces sp. ScaeMP-e48]
MPHTALETLASGVAARLPGGWTSTYQHCALYEHQFPTINRLWDTGHVQHIASTYVLGHGAVLCGPEGQELYVTDRPRYPHEAVVAPLEPDRAGVRPHHFDGVEEPSGIAVPTDPVRAAATVARRLLPRYEQALLEVLQQVEELPEPAHHASRARTAPLITGLSNLEAGLPTTALARQATSSPGGRAPIRRS